jgi:hypothetical protein
MPDTIVTCTRKNLYRKFDLNLPCIDIPQNKQSVQRLLVRVSNLYARLDQNGGIIRMWDVPGNRVELSIWMPNRCLNLEKFANQKLAAHASRSLRAGKSFVGIGCHARSGKNSPEERDDPLVGNDDQWRYPEILIQEPLDPRDALESRFAFACFAISLRNYVERTCEEKVLTTERGPRLQGSFSVAY